METLRIGGIKVSGELVLLNISGSVDFPFAGYDLLERLAGSRINVHFLSAEEGIGPPATSCCVEAGVMDRVRTLLDLDPPLKERIQVVPSVGLLSLFPHQFSFGLMGRCIGAMLEADIPLLGMNSSLSALTFILDYRRLKDAVETLGRFLDFPRPAGWPPL